MSAVRDSSGAEVSARLVRLVHVRSSIAQEVVSVGIPILMAYGELLRGPKVLVPGDAENETVTPDRVERWSEDGWVDLREANCARWIERFVAIHREISAIPEEDTSSRYLRNHRFWDQAKQIQPGKLVGWILSVEERGDRLKR